MSRYRFRPPLWAMLATVVVVAAFVRLGFWQIHRAEEKKAIISAYLEAAKAEPADLGESLRTGASIRSLERKAVQIRGRMDAEHTLLLDNQVSQERPGYHVWSPMVLEDGGAIALVDRGWVPMDPDRGNLPLISVPQGTVTLRGVWQALPRPGIRLGPDNCDKSRWPRIVEYPLQSELQCILGPQVVDGVLWLDPQSTGGFRREWHDVGFPPERHYGYAFQWFALAAAVMAVFFAVNVRKVDSR